MQCIRFVYYRADPRALFHVHAIRLIILRGVSRPEKMFGTQKASYCSILQYSYPLSPRNLEVR